MQHSQIVICDAWIQEVEEAIQLADEIESRIKDQQDSVMAIPADSSQRILGARRKLMLLGTILDRLESLVHNPPAKPILSPSDLQNRRDMISALQQRTRLLASFYCTSQSATKQDTRHTSDRNTDQRIAKVKAEKSPRSEKDQACFVEEVVLDVPLLDDRDKKSESNKSLPWIVHNHFPVGDWTDRLFLNCCPIFILLLIVTAILVLLVVIAATFKYV